MGEVEDTEATSKYWDCVKNDTDFSRQENRNINKMQKLQDLSHVMRNTDRYRIVSNTFLKCVIYKRL